MNILTENEINIKSLEKYFYDCGCRLAAEAFANYLESLDQELIKPFGDVNRKPFGDVHFLASFY